MLKKTKKRKVVAEGSSQQTPKKRGNTFSITVLDSIVVSTSIPIPTQSENPTPQTFDDFDIDFDPSESLTLRRSCSQPQNPNTEATQKKLGCKLPSLQYREENHRKL